MPRKRDANSGSLQASRHASPEADKKQKDDAVVSMIRGLDVLIEYARSSDLTAAARMLYSAKENIVYWAVDQNFHETAEDRFVTQHMLGGSVHSALVLMVNQMLVSGNPLCEELMRAVQSNVMAPGSLQWPAENRKENSV